MKFKNTATALNLKKLYRNEMGADVQFVLSSKVMEGERKVPAHKAVLSAASPVFEKMFYGDLKEGAVVQITDVSFEAFVEFLQFFYMDVIELTEGNIFEVFKLIDKYNLQECQAMCQDYLIETVTPDLVCFYYDVALTFQYSQEIVDELAETICTETTIVLKSNAFKNSSETVFKSVLRMDALNCSEIDVFDAAISWAIEKCKEKERTPSSKNIKFELRNSFSLIRFPTMSEEELVNCSEKYSDLFEMNEFCDILKYKMSSRSLTCAKRFSIIPRNTSHMDAVFWDEKDSIKQHRDPGLYISYLSFRITHGQNVLLYSYDVIQPKRLNWTCDLRLNNINYVMDSYISKTVVNDFKVCRVNLKEPVLCKMNKEYSLKFEMYDYIEEVIELRELKKVNIGGNRFCFDNNNFFVTKLRFQRIV